MDRELCGVIWIHCEQLLRSTAESMEESGGESCGRRRRRIGGPSSPTLKVERVARRRKDYPRSTFHALNLDPFWASLCLADYEAPGSSALDVLGLNSTPTTLTVIGFGSSHSSRHPTQAWLEISFAAITEDIEYNKIDTGHGCTTEFSSS